ncbi:hypothetical protein [Actinoplanes sp. NBRC 103695]|uniref:hypothetical protein n=1 Tax=Actinoplanes sp. NBRC 103695 TaxID=3032202 RepID=UPI0024A399BF|nr:hypothetical protein [Actinoplanes sp. NBRC 103695]GLZ01570.1 hypothetical protein Acsp02_88210 [Actinoplanes sp. NBRC 103695]
MDQIVAECQNQSIDISRDAVEDLLAVKVRNIAAALRVREETVVRSHLRALEPAEMVKEFRLALQMGSQELSETPPTIVDLGSAGRLVASLGQAARCVSLNHQAVNRGEDDKWNAIGVLDDAGDGLTLIGAALELVDVSAGRVSVLLSDLAVLHTRRSLTKTAQNLTSGKWSFGHGPELDTKVAERMTADLNLLPPA